MLSSSGSSSNERDAISTLETVKSFETSVVSSSSSSLKGSVQWSVMHILNVTLASPFSVVRVVKYSPICASPVFSTNSSNCEMSTSPKPISSVSRLASSLTTANAFAHLVAASTLSSSDLFKNSFAFAREM